jgi:hypothetical protein
MIVCLDKKSNLNKVDFEIGDENYFLLEDYFFDSGFNIRLLVCDFIIETYDLIDIFTILILLILESKLEIKIEFCQ